MIKSYLETAHEAHEGNLDQKQISIAYAINLSQIS